MFDLLIYQICMFQTMVFAGTWDGRIFDVLFVRGTMNSASYQAHVKNVCIPKLKQENGGSLQGAILYKSLRVKSPPPHYQGYLFAIYTDVAPWKQEDFKFWDKPLNIFLCERSIFLLCFGGSLLYSTGSRVETVMACWGFPPSCKKYWCFIFNI